MIIKHSLPFKCHIYKWQTSPQLSWNDTYQIWILSNGHHREFFESRGEHNGEFTHECLVTPTRALIPTMIICGLWCQKQVSQAGIINYIVITSRSLPRDVNYSSLSEIPASGTKVLIWCLAFIFVFQFLNQSVILSRCACEYNFPSLSSFSPR